MKLIHLVDYFHPMMGYQENHLSKIQARSGHEVTVITGKSLSVWNKANDPDYTNEVYLQDNELNKINIKVIRLSYWIEYSHRLLLKNLYSIIRSIQPDVIHIHGYFTINAVLGSFFKNVFSYKLIVDDHMLFQGGNNKFASFVNPIFRISFSKYIQKNADYLVAVSNETKEFMQKIYGIPQTKIKLIPLGVDLTNFKLCKQNEMNILIKTLNTENLPVVLYTGKINEEKSPLKALEAAIPLWKKGLDFRFFLVGSGDKDYLQKIRTFIKKENVEKNVILKDAVKTEDLADYFNLATVAVWPCQSSMSALEAMACGCPVILSNSKVNKERLSAGSGLIYDPNIPNDLTLAIEKILTNRELKKQLGSKGIEYTSSLSWENIAKQFEELF